MAKRTDPAPDPHPWEFKPRFRRHAFGWQSQPAITRVKQAVAEIKKVAKKNPLLAAEGAVIFLERVSPALEQVDSSSGSIGTAVNNAITALVPILADAPADPKTRTKWLERLFEAHAADDIPYIERLADHWGELCATRELASAWADRLLGATRMALSPDPDLRGYFHGTSMCLGALFRAERYTEIVELVSHDRNLWDYRAWAVKALAAQGNEVEALRYAESCRSPWASDLAIDRVCEEILLSSGKLDEAYTRYGLRAHEAGTYLATFRAIAKTYPHKPASEILADLVETAPGDEGVWFAAAKDAGLYDEALALASRSPCDPRTLARAARDFVEEQPTFAIGAGMLSLHWVVLDDGFEVTGADVLGAYRATMAAAERLGIAVDTKARVRDIVAAEHAGGFVKKLLGRELGP